MLFSFPSTDALRMVLRARLPHHEYSYHFLAGDEADEIFDLEATIEGFDPMAETLAGIEFRKL